MVGCKSPDRQLWTVRQSTNPVDNLGTDGPTLRLFHGLWVNCWTVRRSPVNCQTVRWSTVGQSDGRLSDSRTVGQSTVGQSDGRQSDSRTVDRRTVGPSIARSESRGSHAYQGGLKCVLCNCLRRSQIFIM